MTIRPFSFTTGAATVPDTGVLFYNGCTFGPLFQTNVSGKAVKDEASRTVKYMEYEITVDGYVTCPPDSTTTDPTMRVLRGLLSAQGGALRYEGRGNDIVVNFPGSPNKDVAWGPIPEILDFQPLGGTRGAKVKWTVKTAIYEDGSAALNTITAGGGPGGGPGLNGPGKGFDAGPVHPGPSKAFIND